MKNPGRRRRYLTSSLIDLWLGGKRGAGVPGYGVRGTGYGVPGYEVPECGKHGVWWKTRGLSAKHGGTIISPNNEVLILLCQIAMKINRLEKRFLVIKAN